MMSPILEATGGIVGTYAGLSGETTPISLFVGPKLSRLTSTPSRTARFMQHYTIPIDHVSALPPIQQFNMLTKWFAKGMPEKKCSSWSKPGKQFNDWDRRMPNR
jgi:hypothetical protein